MSRVNVLQEASTINDIAMNIPTVNASLKYQHADYQSTMLEVDDKILKTPISILIDSGAI